MASKTEDSKTEGSKTRAAMQEVVRDYARHCAVHSKASRPFWSYPSLSEGQIPVTSGAAATNRILAERSEYAHAADDRESEFIATLAKRYGVTL